ncbi:ABC transporter ATP-binding protein [Brucella sp. ZJ1_1]|uniref:ABC transporter related n=3 Tax=Brucella intermedia TaxID=94625 RepID=C4WH42_9HYPH|nr:MULTISPECIES: ABC transporter ATP-binding protein [Brucella/Ochrobactrum group]PJR90530.1 amino acid ABC transporter ATP-binding protein [Ochrobactrum sp. 721/2009]PJT16183.1 amino acid ABC transporter ATP-binding protein [Ochrobactrum sp. 720/2009]PJT26003.1 amino acid ABC transporter ATP-binding protein [Ochrobactrum sp. 715/2009]PJT29609.1 amino acid ABC transporter ATP-binding protein [Ochrobactrum sp. 695/2009]PJT35524.1 amino acid ABC transporter ATP-binding protein [Ochrobactrum sp. 
MIEFDHITKRYNGRAAVDAVSFTIEPHSIAAIVGTSGSGKTTLLRMVNRLVEPTDGEIRIDGRSIMDEPGHVLRRRIGYVIQQNGLFPHRTVAENIATVPLLLGWDKQRIDRRVDELLDLFQLEAADYRDRYPHELSGGQQQRVGVARALAAGPNILLMDEPFGALDPVIRAKAQEDLKAIQKRLGTTIILVTHDMEEAISLGDRIAVMDDGKLLQYGPPAEILARPATDFVERLVGTGERPFRLLSLMDLKTVLQPGDASGETLPVTASQRDALAALLWSGRKALPVLDAEGRPLGRVTLDRLLHQAERPA